MFCMCSYSLFTHDCYRGKNCVKNFCKDLRVYATEVINF